MGDHHVKLANISGRAALVIGDDVADIGSSRFGHLPTRDPVTNAAVA